MPYAATQPNRNAWLREMGREEVRRRKTTLTPWSTGSFWPTNEPTQTYETSRGLPTMQIGTEVGATNAPTRITQNERLHKPGRGVALGPN